MIKEANYADYVSVTQQRYGKLEINSIPVWSLWYKGKPVFLSKGLWLLKAVDVKSIMKQNKESF